MRSLFRIHPHRWYPVVVLPVLVFALAAILLVYTYRGQENLLLEQARQQARLAATDFAATVDRDLESSLVALDRLVAWFRANTLDQTALDQDFEGEAAQLIATTPWILSIGFVREDSAHWAYPAGLALEGGVAAALEDVRQSGGVRLGAPYRLPDGRMEIIVWHGLNEQQGGLWGYAYVVVDFQAILDRALDGFDSELEIALRTSTESVIQGETDLFAQDSVVVPVSVAYSDGWMVAVAPRAGWQALIAVPMRTSLLVGGGLALIITLLTFFVVIQQVRLYRWAEDLEAANRSLGSSEARFRGLITGAHDAIVGLDTDEVITFANLAAEQLFGYASSQLSGQKLEALLRLPDTPGSESAGIKRFTGLVEAEVVHASGQVIPVEVSLSLASEDGRRGPAVLSIRDISERKSHQEALWLSEAKYRSLTEDVLDGSDVGICILDDTFHVVWVNQSFARYFGIPRDQIIGQDKRVLIDRQIMNLFEDGEAFRARVLASYDDNSSVLNFECHVLAGEQRAERWLEHWSQPIASGLYAGGRIEHYYDITSRKEAQLVSERYQAELQAKTESLLAINAVADALKRTLHLPTVIDSGLRLVQEYLGARSLGLFFELEGELLELVSVTGLTTELDMRFLTLPLEGSLSGRAVRERKVQVSANISVDERGYGPFRDYWHKEGIESAVVVPVIAQEQVLGVLCVMFYEVRSLTDVEIETLNSIGKTVGLAVSNALYVAQIQEEVTRRLEAEQAERDQRLLAEALRDSAASINSSLDYDEVMNLILKQLAGVMPAFDVARVLVKTDASHVIVMRSYFPARDSYEADEHYPVLDLDVVANIAFMDRNRQPVVISDTTHDPDWVYFPEFEWIKATLGAPICSGSEVIGFLTIDASQAGVFNATHAQHLMAFANQTGTALRNARMYESEQRQHNAAEMLRDVAVALTGMHGLSSVLDAIVKMAGRVIPNQIAGIWIADTEGMLHLETGTGFERYGAPADLDRISVMLAAFLDHADGMREQVLVVADLAAVEHWQPGPAFSWIRSLITAPIVIQGMLKGRIVFGHAEHDRYDMHDQAVIRALASQVSVAIENERIFLAMQHYLDNMVVLRQFGLEIASVQQDVDEVVPLVMARLAELIPADEYGFWNGDEGQLRLDACTLLNPALPAEERDALIVQMDNLALQLLDAQDVVILDDLQSQDAPLVHERGIRQILFAPLMWRGQPQGALCALSRRAGAFGEDEKQLVQLFASHVTPALVNALLYAEVEQHAQNLAHEVIARTADLERERVQVQAVLDAIGEGVIYLENGVAVFVNPALTRITGYMLQDLQTPQAVQAALPQFDDAEQAAVYDQRMMHVLGLGGVWRDDIIIRRRSGKPLEVSISMTLVHSERQGIVAVVRDVSREKALQEQKDRFIAYASHELRTPLTNLNTRLYLLRRQPEKLPEHLEVIEYVVKRMRRLVEELLELSRLQQGGLILNVRNASLQELVKQVIDVQRPEAEVRGLLLEVETESAPLIGYIDPERIEQVLTNLVGNAINYTPAGGRITVRLQRADEPQRAVIEVSDTGVGIPPEMLNQIFEPFFRVEEQQHGGAGLGLTIAREIIELHGSRLHVESQLGQGTIFRMVLDLA